MPFSSFRRYIKNSMLDGYNTIIDSQCFTIILSLTTSYLINEVILFFFFYLKKLFLSIFLLLLFLFGSHTRLVPRTI